MVLIIYLTDLEVVDINKMRSVNFRLHEIIIKLDIDISGHKHEFLYRII